MKSPVSVASIVVSLVLHGLMIAVVAYTLTSQSEHPPEPRPLETRVVIIPPAVPLPVPVAIPAPRKEIPKPAVMPKPAQSPPTPREVVVAKTESSEAPREIKQAPASIIPPSPAATPVAPPTAAPTPAPPAPQPARTGVSIPAGYAAGNRKPAYPARSQRYGEEGTVMLRVFIKADGTAGDIEIKTSSGYPLLDNAAREAVQSWRFVPAAVDGKPIGEWWQVPIPFKLQN